ncbi:hypothetical protein KUTeg_011010 [Tegillarca granosa]|uniref:ABC transmembrane type-1 domain-containing protein n=1 Tax=Tegillarca granosa TaxID=220873 RepID=A0ABQ9F7U2_TEGGR|nr:hypothetical protein KUTeg_011010 [Tegillarca granosa]
MYAWEPWFSERIISIRKKELRCLKLIAVIVAFSILCSNHSPFFMNYFMFLIYILTSYRKGFNAEIAFGSLSLVNILRYPLSLVPFVIQGFVQKQETYNGYVSISRIQAFLWKEDVDKDNVIYTEEGGYKN